ncbi:MAG: chromate transporter [Bacillota bacterium]
MIYLKLVLSFLKIGCFGFGGGYAILPLIQNETAMHGWLSKSEFADLMVIAEMTPGPITVNSATFVGYKAAGFLGGLAATAAVAFPSLFLIMLIFQFLLKVKNDKIKEMFFYGIRPVVVALILAAAVFISETVIFKHGLSVGALQKAFANPRGFINPGGLCIMLLVLLARGKFKIHPVIALAGAGLLGMLFFYF